MLEQMDTAEELQSAVQPFKKKRVDEQELRNHELFPEGRRAACGEVLW